MMSMLKLYSSENNMRYVSSGRFQWTMNEIRLKLNHSLTTYQDGYGIFLVEAKGDDICIGEASLFNSFNDKTVLEIGYIIDELWSGVGFGVETCSALIFYAFEKLGVKRLVARVNSKNHGSIKVALKSGMAFKTSGKTNDGKDFQVFEIDDVRYKTMKVNISKLL